MLDISLVRVIVALGHDDVGYVRVGSRLGKQSRDHFQTTQKLRSKAKQDASSDAPSYLFTDAVDVARPRTPGCTKAAVSPAWISRRPCDRRCVRLQTVTTRPVKGV
jgi:hypothetical protein